MFVRSSSGRSARTSMTSASSAVRITSPRLIAIRRKSSASEGARISDSGAAMTVYQSNARL